MKIIIATPIYPPQIGGPATYSHALARSLEHAGHKTIVATYGSLGALPSGARHLAYFFRLLARSRGADAIIAFDPYSVGLPAALAHFITRKPLIVRIGGDFLWEQYIERTRDLVPLPQIYAHPDLWGGKERFVFRAVRFVARHATLAFSSDWQREIRMSPYGLDRARTCVIENAIAQRVPSHKHVRKNFLLFGRQIALKNAAAFNRAFGAARRTAPNIELEEGIVPHEDLMKKLADCYAVALPSISDVTPNGILEAIQYGKPFLITKYSAYAERYKDFGIVVDPLSESDMTRGILALADSAMYEQLRNNIAAFSEIRTYDQIAREFLALLTPSSP